MKETFLKEGQKVKLLAGQEPLKKLFFNDFYIYALCTVLVTQTLQITYGPLKT